MEGGREGGRKGGRKEKVRIVLTSFTSHQPFLPLSLPPYLRHGRIE